MHTYNVTKKALAIPALALLSSPLFSPPLQAAEAVNPPRPTVADIVKASKPAEWRALDPEHTLYMDLPAGRVVIELAPAFAPAHDANIRTLVREHYFDGLAMLRSHDNYVAQWGDPDEKNPRPFKSAKAKLTGEFTVPMSNDKHFTQLPDRDGYAAQVGHSNGFPSARDPKTGRAWLAHCYGMVGVGRDVDADSGNGSSLYAVTGHAPRHLDRNITVVGRVVSGMPLLSSLPRGTGALGFYEQAEQRMPIKSVRLAADVPEAERVKLEVMRTDSASFKAVAEAQRNRGGPWTKVPAGHVELCNVTIPVR
ncbi:peptidylprolyl isomerase [Massilia sp. Root418]|jgi:peptidylprolyl isomerase|uniref:peptidylprolyl isomerase n=1 Tax=Massilia sp. Root418 TaxID=1736532 RepID=UPI0006FE1F0A|nr:peptidylprolyl isomerase [Massilia sp. Root418]KQW96472.1 peptidylprolyl isomerase [Massilia sp. Root418]